MAELAGPQSIRAKYFTKRNIAFFGMIVGMFMSILDIQIVASSLPVIAAGLSATPDELSWIQTAYIIAEVAIIPLTGFTAKLLSTRISYVIATLGFTLMSILCAFAGNIESMIIYRALQGFFGGAMIPTVFATIYLVFEPKERPLVTIVIGLVVTMAPTLGPTIGGYITEISSWHFMFLVNVIPGIFVCTVVFLYADFDKPNYSLLKNFDFIGVILLISSLGSLQYVLEEGTRKNWFESNLILFLSIYVICALCTLVYHELTTKNPILDLYAFRNRNFTIGCLLSGIIGTGLYGSVFLLPIFLGQVANLTTLQIGVIMGVMGISQFCSAPIAATMMKKNVDRRYMMAFGLLAYGIGCYLNSFLTFESRLHELILPQMVRGFSLMFCFIPINDIALSSLSKSEIQNASGLYNLMRNLGGATGLAIINSTLINNSIIYRDILASNLQTTGEIAKNNLMQISNLISDKVANPDLGAIMIINNLLSRESFIIAINNMFTYITILYLFGLTLIIFIKSTQTANQETNAH